MPPIASTAEVLCVDMTAEASFGTPQATPDKRWAFSGRKITPKNDWVDDTNRKTGVYTIGSNKIKTKQWIEESFEFDGRLDTLAALAKMALGQLTTTGAGPTYTHTAVEKNGNNDSYTWYYKDALTTGGNLDQCPGLKIARLTFSLQAGGMMAIKADLIGKGAETETGTTSVAGSAPSQNTDPQLIFANISAFTLGGADTKAKLKEFELVIEPQYDRNNAYSAGSLYMQHLVKTGLKLSGRMVLEFDANTQVSDAVSGTAKAISMTLTQGTSNAVIDLYKVFLTDASVDGADKNNTVRKPYTIEPFYSDSDSKGIQIAVTNTVAAYT